MWHGVRCGVLGTVPLRQGRTIGVEGRRVVAGVTPSPWYSLAADLPPRYPMRPANRPTLTLPPAKRNTVSPGAEGTAWGALGRWAQLSVEVGLGAGGED